MNLSKFLTASLVGSVSAYSWAIEPMSVDIRGFQFTPTLQVYQSYDDNYRGLRDNTLDSWITGVKPTFALSAENRNSQHELKYSFNTDYYHDDNDATNTDHHLTLKSALALSSRHRVRGNLGYHRIEDTINDDTRGRSDDLAGDLIGRDFYNDKYSRAVAGLGYTFGASSAQNQLDFAANYEQRRYHNSGNINEDQERDSLGGTASWFHRLGGRTRSIVEVRHTQHDYVDDRFSRDGTNTAGLVGATWEATARTTGTVRVGAERKKFDSGNRDNFTSPMWEVGVAWEPRSYSTFEINARRAFDEGEDDASTVEDVTTILSWTHGWTPRISTEIEYQYSDREYKASNREDERTAYSVGVNYAFDRWADITLGYRRSDNDSTRYYNNYERNVYLLSLNMSL